ncbi:MAG: AHH domain-containing protein [Thermodesulfobacteriota bacterium]
MLEKFKIDLYDPANGVWLPRLRGVGEGAYHPGLHSPEYYLKVEGLLRKATTREEAIGILKKIGRKLSSGTFFE